METSSFTSNHKDKYIERPVALVVDDDIALLQILRSICEMLQFDVVTAENGEEAWELFNTEWPDIVISDIYMPKMNGVRLMLYIKSANPNVPVVLVTGDAHYKQLLATGGTKPDGFIKKPFEVEALCKTIIGLRRSVNQSTGIFTFPTCQT